MRAEWPDVLYGDWPSRPSSQWVALASAGAGGCELPAPVRLVGALNRFHVEALLADRWGRNRIFGDRTVAEGLTSRTAASNNGTSDAAAWRNKILAAPNATSPGDPLSNQRYRWRHHFSDWQA
jgi:hypothetical protein